MLATTSASFPQRKNPARLHSVTPPLFRDFVASLSQIPKLHHERVSFPAYRRARKQPLSLFALAAELIFALPREVLRVSPTAFAALDRQPATSGVSRVLPKFLNVEEEAGPDTTGAGKQLSAAFVGLRIETDTLPPNLDTLPHTVCENTGNTRAFVTSRTALHRRDR